MARQREPGKPLAKPRHEIAAREYAAGATEDEAYASAGFAPDSGNASRFFTGKDSVRERVEELLEQAALLAVEEASITRGMVLGGILDKALNSKSDGASVAAWKLLGQANVVGLFVPDDENTQSRSVPEMLRSFAGDNDELYRMLLERIPLAPSEKQ